MPSETVTPRAALPVAIALMFLAPAAALAEAGDEPYVFTNADLPSELSVSVIGASGSGDDAGTWVDMDEIERIAALNERARRENEEFRPKSEPEILVVEERRYPWVISNVGCIGVGRCRPFVRGPRAKPQGPHLRNALPDPPEGFVLRPGPHLESDSARPPVRRGPRGHVVPGSSRGHVTPRSPR